MPREKEVLESSLVNKHLIREGEDDVVLFQHHRLLF
jgi:hypothetical protein